MQAETFNNVMGVILVGGKSSRMGKDKALVCIDEETFMHKVSRDLQALNLKERAIVGNVSVLAKLPRDFMHIMDLYENRGPLAGIYSALSYAQINNAENKGVIDGILVVPIDMPALTPDILKNLAIHGRRTNRLTYYECEGQKLPFPLYIPLDEGLIENMENLLVDASKVKSDNHEKQKALSMRGILNHKGAQKLVIDDEKAFININTPDDLRRFSSQTLTVGK
jgi:molybdopterin-guanine dinucleotide biosynthesis protein A